MKYIGSWNFTRNLRSEGRQFNTSLCLLIENPQHLRPAERNENEGDRETKKRLLRRQINGGDEEIRTPDLVSAIQALSQLSYVPTSRPSAFFRS